ncbi:unnamed protein product [Parnassius mnemosyne]|uniref:Secreted protein n=1 Tax=Parnassius mnemosyne TaxID=213953 RepID=A0AAV1KR73_9NEOP
MILTVRLCFTALSQITCLLLDSSQTYKAIPWLYKSRGNDKAVILLQASTYIPLLSTAPSFHLFTYLIVLLESYSRIGDLLLIKWHFFLVFRIDNASTF